MKPNPQILEHALNDLDEIVLYIAQNSKTVADKMRCLLDFPKRGRPIPDSRLQQLGFRMLFVKRRALKKCCWHWFDVYNWLRCYCIVILP